jgi:uncharacterized phiE125 gp8 family phage protein
MALKLLTPPLATNDVVSLAEIKQHCRVDHSDEDALLATYVKAAVSHFENHTGMIGVTLGQQTWALYCDSLPCEGLEIPLRPLIAVDAFEYLDPAAGIYVTWPTLNYTVDLFSYRGRIAPVADWPVVKDVINAVKITFKAGFGSSNADVPVSLRVAVMQLAGHWYQNRETTSDMSLKELPFAVEALISQWREIRV